jgi:hypothetical protein
LILAYLTLFGSIWQVLKRMTWYLHRNPDLLRYHQQLTEPSFGPLAYEWIRTLPLLTGEGYFSLLLFLSLSCVRFRLSDPVILTIFVFYLTDDGSKILDDEDRNNTSQALLARLIRISHAAQAVPAETTSAILISLMVSPFPSFSPRALLLQFFFIVDTLALVSVLR